MSSKLILGFICFALHISQGLSSSVVPSAGGVYRRENVSETRMVNSPGGLVPAENIHLVPTGARVQRLGDFIHIVAQNGTKLHSVPVSETPAAKTRPSAASSLSRRAFGSGYVAYTWWENPSSSPMSYFTTTWTVPPVPSNVDGQLLYMFNSMEPTSFNAILQPVLQYGVSPAGGGNYWSVASWWLVGSDVYHSPLTQVSPGQSLEGVMILQNITTSASGTAYNYNSVFTGIPDSAISISSSQELTSAWEALEIYTASGATDLPHGRTAMSSINLFTMDGQRAPLVWSSSSDSSDGFSTDIVIDGATNGQVDLIYPLQ